MIQPLPTPPGMTKACLIMKGRRLIDAIDEEWAATRRDMQHPLNKAGREMIGADWNHEERLTTAKAERDAAMLRIKAGAFFIPPLANWLYADAINDVETAFHKRIKEIDRLYYFEAMWELKLFCRSENVHTSIADWMEREPK